MNSLKKGEAVTLLNVEEGPEVPLLNFEGGPGDDDHRHIHTRTLCYTN